MMIWLILCWAIAADFLLVALIKNVKSGVYKYWKNEPFLHGLLGLLYTLFALLISTLVGGLFAHAIGHFTGMEDNIKPREFNIVAAADGSNMEGSFFLFGGSVDEEPVYFFYRQDRPDGPIRQGNIPASATDLYEDTEREGYIKVNKRHFYCEWWRCNLSEHKTYEVHVPKGSVVRQFNFDLE